MNTQNSMNNSLVDIEINNKLKLSLLWVSLLFLYIYVDYFHLYMPNKIEEIRAGRVFDFAISQGFLLLALAFMSIPALMIFLSVALRAPLNRKLNMIVAALYIPFTLFNLAGEAWPHMVLGAVLEVMLLCLIVFYACRWPRN